MTLKQIEKIRKENEKLSISLSKKKEQKESLEKDIEDIENKLLNNDLFIKEEVFSAIELNPLDYLEKVAQIDDLESKRIILQEMLLENDESNEIEEVINETNPENDEQKEIISEEDK